MAVSRGRWSKSTTTTPNVYTDKLLKFNGLIWTGQDPKCSQPESRSPGEFKASAGDRPWLDTMPKRATFLSYLKWLDLKIIYCRCLWRSLNAVHLTSNIKNLQLHTAAEFWELQETHLIVLRCLQDSPLSTNNSFRIWSRSPSLKSKRTFHQPFGVFGLIRLMNKRLKTESKVLLELMFYIFL